MQPQAQEKDPTIWYVLQKIKKLLAENPNPRNTIQYITRMDEEEEGAPNNVDQNESIFKLGYAGVINYSMDDETSMIGMRVFAIAPRQPQFDQLYKEYEKAFPAPKKPVIKEEKIEEILKEEVVMDDKNIRPYCIVESSFGYLKFGKFGAKVKIGRADGQPFRLLQCLTEPFGVAKVIDTAYEAIREAKDKKRMDVYTGRFDKGQKLRVIQNTIKEVQKGKKLKGKIKFAYDDVKSRVWLEYIG